MKRLSIQLLAFATILVAQQVMAQFQAILIQAPPAAPLVTACEGATPLPEGTLVKIFLDVDSDGPDFDDPQPTVCSDPPECGIPFASVNYDQFLINGVEQEIGAGYFFTDPAFNCTTTIPGSGRFYLRAYEPDNTTILWTSAVFTVHIGAQEVIFVDNDWSCGSTGPQCVVIDESE